MVYEFKFPAVGEGVVEGEIVRWLIKEGDEVKEGQPLVEMEIDKALMEISSPRAGVVLRIPVKEKELVNVGQVILTLGEKAETAPPLEVPSAQIPETEEAPSEVTPAPRPEIRTKFRKYDFYGHLERVPLRGVRRSVARAMVKSKYTAPHATAMDEADVTALWKIREKEKEAAEKKGIRLTLLPFIIKAAVAGLAEHPYLNASLDDENDEIILKKYFNIGFAADTPEGLVVPVIKSANDKSILQMAEELFQLAEKARNRSIDLADLKGGTFTVTNYGAVGGIFGTPIINYPEVAILGVGKAVERTIVRDGKIAVGRILPLALSFDHRVADGAEATRFLNTVIAHLQDPDLILLKG